MLKDLHILLTNDDNHESPLLHWLIDLLKHDNQVTVVAPAAERSWTGKGMTCEGVLTVESTSLYDCQAFYVDGLPADCVNIGVHHLCQQRPDLIVSGINAGRNTASSFVISSGTVGACFEANILGIPAVALSQNLEPELMQQWRATRVMPKNRRIQLKKQIEKMIPKTFEFLNPFLGHDTPAVTWNVNFPSFWNENQDIKILPVNHGRYGSIFIRAEGGFQHFVSVDQIFKDTEPESDAAAL
ncbi:MAG: 5'/3'-nucleotidase SurE, partial [Bdellovibrionales bacterium]|nr:5'/3'-nucleotidase SurE [Bdellovibrionales bacterium]